MSINKSNSISIYEENGKVVQLNVDYKHSTVWATQTEISRIFSIDRTVATKHINKIFKNNEVSIKSNVQKMHFANSDKPVKVYSLDVILAVGYRANTQKAIHFRKWASKVLKEYIINGYSVNKSLIKSNYEKFSNIIKDIKILLPKDNRRLDISKGVIEIISTFAYTWLSLEAYDKKQLPKFGSKIKKLDLTAEELIEGIVKLKENLVKQKIASELFAVERENNNLKGIIRSVYQSFNGEDVYKSLEEKAANLLYLVVKNHPFIDGNKRVGAFSFIWFLTKAGLLNPLKITPEVLTTLTILIAESKTEDKERMIGIVLHLLNS